MNHYEEKIQSLFRLRKMSRELGLKNIETLLAAVGNPHHHFQSIHIAGTNGKGSTAAVIEAIGLAADYNVGLYTSPHLIDFRERIRVNRRDIPEASVIRFIEMLDSLIEKIEPSFFEVSTAMAFWYFAEQQIDFAVIETGMGGRLDATNVLQPLLSVITYVGYDHQKYLGSSLEAIAAEKGGIIKSGVPCVTSNRELTVQKKILEICQKKNSSFHFLFDNNNYEVLKFALDGTIFNLRLDNSFFENVYLNLPGEHQLENALLAAGALRQVRRKINIPDAAIVQGLKSVQWRGRIQLVSKKPTIIVDVSHNASGFNKTLTFIHRFFPKKDIKAITFLQHDKDYKEISRILTDGVEEVIIGNLPLGAPLEADIFLKEIQQKGGTVRTFDSFTRINECIAGENTDNTLWLIIGSHYLAGEAYRNLQLS